MKVRELVERLCCCNPDAEVVVQKHVEYSEDSAGDEVFLVTDLLPWPEPMVSCEKIELVAEEKT